VWLYRATQRAGAKNKKAGVTAGFPHSVIR
jgi:hypothetical protein